MRSTLHFAVLFPALAGAALYTGTVSSQENHPLAGVVVKLASDSVVTGNDGTWSLARTADIQSHDTKAIDGIRHLVRQGSRISLVWQDHDILGRDAGARLNPPSNQRAAISARTMASIDTIVIRWNGKNLSRIPVSSFDTTIVQVIDTSWKDDAGIPWNPRITYGSLPDTRDGQTYRTTKIGSQTWMADNLNFAADSSWCYENSEDSCSKYGRFYQWVVAMGLDTSYNHKVWNGTLPHQGICTNGWHVPSNADWDSLSVANKGGSSGRQLMSTLGWSSNGNGTDAYGFRALSSGWRGNAGRYVNINDAECWWSAEQKDQFSSLDYFINSAWGILQQSSNTKTAAAYPLRCLKDPL